MKLFLRMTLLYVNYVYVARKLHRTHYQQYNNRKRMLKISEFVHSSAYSACTSNPIRYTLDVLTQVKPRNYHSQRISVIDITLSRTRMQYDKST